ncbi:MAG: Do family serine endopeptidase [Elusimicrobiota bacterium]|nr:Do family serine endopeptidase [Elusimicrobiota bacterium]
MENPNSLRKNLLLTSLVVMLSGLFILAFILGKSQKKSDQNYGVKTSVSQEVLNLQEAFADVFDEGKDAVVSIYTEQVLKDTVPFNFFFADPFEDFFDDFFGQPAPNRKAPQKKHYNQRRIEGVGSGVVIDNDGYILTNYHVVKNAEKITVKLADEREYSGKIIGKDAKTDLAVIKIKPSGKLAVAKLGDSDKIRVGDWAIAIGSPFDLAQSLNVGVISAKRQNIRIGDNIYRDFIQTDAPINRGNSGGPLLNIHGEVVGINTAIFSQSGVSVGVGFAIPINRAKEILETLKTKGKVERGFLGVGQLENVNDVFVKQYGLKEKTGVMVGDVVSGSAAEKAGIKRGDIILEFGGQKIESVEKLQDIVAVIAPNKKIDVVVWRDNSKKVISVVLGEWTEEQVASVEETAPEKSEKTGSWLGMKVKQFTKDMAEELNVTPEEQGVVIVDIESGSKAAAMGLYAGDVIRAINRKKTATLTEFEMVTKKAFLTDGILFDINRSGNLIYKTYIEQ